MNIFPDINNKIKKIPTYHAFVVLAIICLVQIGLLADTMAMIRQHSLDLVDLRNMQKLQQALINYELREQSLKSESTEDNKPAHSGIPSQDLPSAPDIESYRL